METVLVGRFENFQMIAARPSKILCERCNKGIKEIKVEPVKNDAPILKYNFNQFPSVQSNHFGIGDQPRVMDPYAKKNIYIGKNEGVYAKRKILRGELVMYYSGLKWNQTNLQNYPNVKVPKGSTLYSTILEETYKNQTYDDYWRNWRASPRYYLPKHYWMISNYRATLGHKVRHSFKHDKTSFGKVHHPRFGEIRSIYAKETINKGEEVLVNYGYLEGRLVPQWIEDLYFKDMGQKWPGCNKFFDEDCD